MPDSFVTPWTVTRQAPLSMGFPRQEYWNGLPFPSPRDLPNPETEPVSLSLLHWQVHSSLLSQLESPPHTKSLFSCSVTSDCLQPHGLRPARLDCPWDFPGKNIGMGCHSLLQGIFPTQGWNLCLLHWQADSLPLSHQGSTKEMLVGY